MMFRSLINRSCFAGLVVCAILGANHFVRAADQPQAGEKVWTTSTFLDFVDGSLSDGGVNSYVAADGSVRLINLRDLNSDGQIDIVFSNTHDHNEQMDLLIYWNKDGFSPDRRAQLPTDGGQKSAVADLNGDGFSDLVVVNRFNGTKSELNAYIYWGNKRGLDANRRTELPTRGAEAVAVADLNRDGHADLIFANSGLSYHVNVDNFKQSFIYWGSSDGYSKDRRSTLQTVHANDVKVADLNQDSFPDIIFANEGNTNTDGGALIYWGNVRGEYSEKRSTRLPGERSSAVAAADLDGDGNAEIILANAFRLGKLKLKMYAFVDTVVLDSFIYWGSPEGYSADRKTALPTVKAADVAVGDLNGDGRPDVVFANQAGGASYVYWGGESGFHANRRTSLPTLRAANCAVADLNGDGHPDLIFANNGDAHRHRIDSYVYWGGRDGFSPARRTNLPTWGATGITVGDLNQDGTKDLVFTHEEDGTVNEAIDSWIYWGDRRGRYTPRRRDALPTKFTYGHTAADLNQDGYVDLFFSGNEPCIYWGSSRGFFKENKSVVSSRFTISGIAADFNRDGYLDLSLSDGPPWADDTRLYWGGPNGFSQENCFIFQTKNAGRLTTHSAADLNRDGWLDIIFPTWSQQVFIYWGGPGGFDNRRHTTLPCQICGSSEVADLNGDGFLDLVVNNKFDPNPAPGKAMSYGGDPNTSTYVYWGDPRGYSPDRRLKLPVVGGQDAAVADLDGDGRLDLVVSSYHAGHTRMHPSYIYWNSAQGFGPRRVTMLPTNSASGVMLADFNQDGRKDILFTCHSKDGNHRNGSFLYWGSKDGYSKDRRSSIPGHGPHNMTAVDPGNVYDRGDHYDYVSPVFDGGPGARFKSITWKGTTPFRTRLEFQVRTAAKRDALQSAPWRGPGDPDSVFQTPGDKLKATPKDHRWIQYKASLISPDSVNTPVLESVSIQYSRPSSG